MTLFMKMIMRDAQRSKCLDHVDSGANEIVVAENGYQKCTKKQMFGLRCDCFIL